MLTKFTNINNIYLMKKFIFVSVNLYSIFKDIDLNNLFYLQLYFYDKNISMEKYILITGASSGLGKAAAKKLAQEGFKVFAGVRKQQDKDTLDSLHKNITSLFLDVTNEESLNQAFAQIASTTDRLYALVNNAGIALAGPVEYLPSELLKKQFDVNVFGAISVAQKALPLMQNVSDARIVNISSMAGYGIFPFVSPYCASKRALDMFFNSLLLECKMPQLKVISIKPGVVATPIWNKSVDASFSYFENIEPAAGHKYAKELEFLSKNARKNTNKGLKAEDIANLVYKVLSVKNPKLSYNIGKDSVFARFMSFLPQGLVNGLVKFGLKTRI